MVRLRLHSRLCGPLLPSSLRSKTWQHVVLFLLLLSGLYTLNSLSAASDDERVSRKQPSVSEEHLSATQVATAVAVTATQPPVTTTPKQAHVNPLLELRRSGQRVSWLQRQAVVSRFESTVPLQPSSSTADHDLIKKDAISALSYGACSPRSCECVVAYPLPESVFPQTVTFCVHSGPDVISDSIRSAGVWEYPFTYFIWATLAQDADMHFIDMGANVGAMSLVAAKLGRRVVAVEPLRATLDILCRGVIENNVTDRVTIVPFALSDRHSTFKTLTDWDNWGHTFLVKDHNETTYSETVTTILTSDLLPFISFDKAFLKVDVEGFEPAAFRSAVPLFDKVHIPVILMEWGRMQEHVVAGNSEPLSILDFLYGRGYSAYITGGVKLNRANHRSWGEDIHWIHDTFTYEVDPWSVF